MRTLGGVGPFPDEKSSWSAALKGDADGFAAVYDQNLARTYRHALRLAGNRHDAEDLVAATFMELWRRRSRVRLVGGSVLPWLLVTVTNLDRNRTRGLRRYRSLLASLPRDQVTSPAADCVVEEIATRSAAAEVRDALRQLTPPDAAVFSLVAFEEYTPAQAAEVLGISAGAARTRLHRARQRLAAKLGDDPSQSASTALTEENLR